MIIFLTNLYFYIFKNMTRTFWIRNKTIVNKGKQSDFKQNNFWIKGLRNKKLLCKIDHFFYIGSGSGKKSSRFATIQKIIQIRYYSKTLHFLFTISLGFNSLAHNVIQLFYTQKNSLVWFGFVYFTHILRH